MQFDESAWKEDDTDAVKRKRPRRFGVLDISREMSLIDNYEED